MELIFKATVLCVAAVVFGLVLKKSNPEIALLIGLAATLVCVWLGVELMHSLLTQFQAWQQQSLVNWAYFVPLLKCVAISFVTQLGMGLCKDSGYSATATALELCGNLASAWCMIPLLIDLFALLEDML